MYNPMVNQFERLIELGEGGKPAQMKFSISKVDIFCLPIVRGQFLLVRWI